MIVMIDRRRCLLSSHIIAVVVDWVVWYIEEDQEGGGRREVVCMNIWAIPTYLSYIHTHIPVSLSKKLVTRS